MPDIKSASRILKPSALRKGDRVSLISPASRPYSPSLLRRSISVIESMELIPVVGAHALDIHGYMAGSDESRLEDLNHAIRDPDIRGIFVLEGGYGSLRLLPGVDYERLKSDPKVIVGSDEATCLLLAIHQLTGLIVFHGPNLSRIDRSEAQQELERAIKESKILPALDLSDAFAGGSFLTFFSGVKEGRTTGGNLTALSSLMGTPFAPDLTGRILLLCDVNERNDILDRWITNLYASATLGKVAAIVFGEFDGCGPRSSLSVLSFEDLLLQRMKQLSVCSCFGLPFGQSSLSRVVPLGVESRVDTEQGSLSFLELALVR